MGDDGPRDREWLGTTSPAPVYGPISTRPYPSYPLNLARSLNPPRSAEQSIPR
jgi:hypothetical protein